MNIINIINMLLISIDLAATGKIITCTGKKVDPILHVGGGGAAAPMKTYVNCKVARMQDQKINIKNVRKASLLGGRLGHHTVINTLI